MIRVVACGVLAPLCWGKCGRGSPPATWVLGITTGKIGIFLTQQIMHSRAYLHNIRRGGWGGGDPLPYRRSILWDWRKLFTRRKMNKRILHHTSHSSLTRLFIFRRDNQDVTLLSECDVTSRMHIPGSALYRSRSSLCTAT